MSTWNLDKEFLTPEPFPFSSGHLFIASECVCLGCLLFLEPINHLIVCKSKAHQPFLFYDATKQPKKEQEISNTIGGVVEIAIFLKEIV